jgi:hypothetical protein
MKIVYVIPLFHANFFKVLTVFFTEIEMCHRFIKFMVPNHITNWKKFLSEYIKEVQEEELGINFHRLQ